MKKLSFFMFSIFIFSTCYCQLEDGRNKINSSEDYFNFYQKNISDLRGSSCQMYPSCANYTIEIIKEKGIIQGIINGSDRLGVSI